jgi:hypothetical protein
MAEEIVVADMSCLRLGLDLVPYKRIVLRYDHQDDGCYDKDWTTSSLVNHSEQATQDQEHSHC